MRGRANALECYGYCVQMLGLSYAGRWGACDLARYCVLCTPGSHGGQGRTLLCLVSPPYIRLCSRCLGWCLRVSRVSTSVTLRQLRVPSLARPLTSCSCPASPDAIYAFLDQAQPSLTRHYRPVASSEAKQQNTSVFGKYTR